MTRLPGHEDCATCPTCHKPICPDCDSTGQACAIYHPGEPYTCGICGGSFVGGDGHIHTADEARAALVRQAGMGRGPGARWRLRIVKETS